MFLKIKEILSKILWWLKSVYDSKNIVVKVPPSPTEPPWITIARAEVGVKEFMPGDNPRIVEYHKVTNYAASSDSVPWCASFVGWCLEKSKIPSTKSARAKSYLDWGMELDTPKFGCITVFNRDSGGHVAFYIDEDQESIFVLGGNQNDSVKVSAYPKNKLLGFRWPILNRTKV
jgi:uncharacterized protein (TIGR02594 family)